MKNLFNWVTSSNSIADSKALTSAGLLVLRVSVGLMMALGHGWGKLASYSQRAGQFPDPLGVGNEFSLILVIVAEFFCAWLLVLGLFTRGAVIPLIITMLVAGLVIHGDDPWRQKELAMLFLTTFATIFIAGPGRYSLDRLLARK